MYTVKHVEEGDLPTLAGIMARAFTVADPEKPWDEHHALEYLTYWFHKQPDMFFGAYDEGGNPVGALAVNIKPWRTGIRASDGGLFVDVLHQRKGVATLLSKTVLVKAIELYGVSMVEAISFAGDTFQLRWFKKLGLVPDTHAIIIKGDTNVILENLNKG